MILVRYNVIETLSTNRYNVIETLSTNRYNVIETLSTNRYNVIETLSTNVWGWYGIYRISNAKKKKLTINATETIHYVSSTYGLLCGSMFKGLQDQENQLHVMTVLFIFKLSTNFHQSVWNGRNIY